MAEQVGRHPPRTDGHPALDVPEEAVEQLRARLRGPLLGPEHPDYDRARVLYNAMFDRHPALIAQCMDAADVMAVVDFARTHRVELAVRGGGHNAAGLGSVDNGLVADLSLMRGVRVDPAERTVRVEGGALMGDVDHATHAFGRVVPAGFISTTGMGGLTLGGGLGHLTRRFGYTVDSLLAADVVLADGQLVTASADSHPDLFWALRGGGGNFGVVTSFLFRSHPLHTVVAGPMFWPQEETAEHLRWFREFLPKQPREVSGFFAIQTIPPAPPFPEALHGRKICGVVWCYTGPPEKADEALAPARARKPLVDGVQSMPFPALQRLFDALYPPGMQWYWKADFFRELPDEAIARHVEFGAQLPSGRSAMHLYAVDGAARDVAPEDTAFSFRDAQWAEVIIGVDPDPANAGRITRWAREYWQALHPFSAGGAYVNFMMDEGQERVQATYRDNFRRLAEVKRRYDPTNLFHVNQNVKPAPLGEGQGEGAV